MIKVVIVDDHAILREGVRLILEADPDIEVIGQASDGLEAVQLAVDLHPDLIILDLHMPRMDGLEACERIGRQAPNVKILVLSQKDSQHYLEKALQMGAQGFVLKDSAYEELLTATHVVMRGEMYLTPQLTSVFVKSHFEKEKEKADRSRQLSDREVEVLKLIASGLTNARISEELNLSVKTVQSHRSNIRGKLRVRDTLDLIKYAIRSGLVTEKEVSF